MHEENIILNSVLSDVPIFFVGNESDSPANCSGANEKHLLLITEQQLTSEQLMLLTKILQAVEYNLEKDALLLKHKVDQPLNLHHVIKGRTVEKVIVFSHVPSLLGLSVQHTPYQAFQLAGKTFLFADSIEKISADKSLKSALWNALKAMFPKKS
ncbi:MAG: hypothetical protein AAF990_14020 [Bacteroidota bacterium]